MERAGGDRLEAFVAAIVTAHGGFCRGIVTIDDVVFDSTRVAACCAVPPDKILERDSSIEAETIMELALLLTAAVEDGLDFIFEPTPKPFEF